MGPAHSHSTACSAIHSMHTSSAKSRARFDLFSPISDKEDAWLFSLFEKTVQIINQMN